MQRAWHRRFAGDGPAAAQEGPGRLPGPRPGTQAERLPDLPRCRPSRGPTPLDERPHNPFGKRLKAVRSELKKAGKPSGIPARIEAVADEDSDGDGIPNLLELVTGHFPGEADDRPAAAELAKGRAAIAALKQAASGYAWNPFERVARPELPVVRSRGWVRNPIDFFIAAEHECTRPDASARSEPAGAPAPALPRFDRSAARAR